MRVRVERTVDTEEWNRLIVSCPGGSLFQSTYWARFMEEYLGVPGYFMSAFDGTGQTVGCLLFFNEPPGYRRLFFERPLSDISLPFLRWALPTLTWLHGPLVKSSDPRDRRTVCERMLAEVNEFGSNLGAVGVAPSPAPIHGVSGNEFKEVYTDLGFLQKQWATFLVDLTAEEEVLWGRLDRSARKAIRKTEREGVQVERIGTLEELEQYYVQAVPYWRSRGARGVFVQELFSDVAGTAARRSARGFRRPEGFGDVGRVGSVGLQRSREGVRCRASEGVRK